MLILATTASKAQIVTSAAGTVNVYAALVDGVSAINPGAVFTATISTAATTDVVAAPASGVFRNIQTLLVRNNHASVSNDVTVQLTDGTNVEPVFKATLAVGESLQYVDGDGFAVFDATGGRKTATVGSGRFLKVTVLTSASGTHTTDPAARTIRTCLQAGGGAGGGAATVASGGGAGGGGAAGGYAEKLFTVTGNTGYSYACGAGGTAGTAGANPGNAGGNTTFAVGATTVTANGGPGGTGMAAGTATGVALGGAPPSVSTNGDLNGSGAPGAPGIRQLGTIAVSGAGGSCVYGSGHQGLIAQGTGVTGVGFGPGGSGGVTLNGGAATAGGPGRAGCIVVEEYS